MAPVVTTDDKLEYLLNVLKNCAEFKPDYHKTAAETGCANANKAQIKFKKILEEGGKYLLVHGKIIAVGDDGEGVPATPSPVKGGTGKGRGRPKKVKDDSDNVPATPPSKKRKIMKKDDVEEAGDDANDSNDDD